MQESDNQKGVVIPQETLQESNAKKSKGTKPLAQLPVYRAASNLKYIVMTLMAKSPRNLTKFFDQMLATVSEVKKSIGMASISRTPEDRAFYLECARVLVQDVSDDFTTLRRFEMPARKNGKSEEKDDADKSHRLPLVGRDLDNKAKALMKSIIAQLVAWRDYTMNEGANSETDSERKK
jgi:hypothetical protein